MSDPSLMRHRVARGGALACSLALGGFVIVNAQLGCDAPADQAPEQTKPAEKSEPAKVEPAKVEPAKAEPAAVEPAAVEPAAVEPAVAEPAVEPPPADKGNRANAAKAEPVYMPASKSGGDFGAMQFPGQGQINPAPEPTPQQQAPK
jgi:hypothetical protein